MWNGGSNYLSLYKQLRSGEYLEAIKDDNLRKRACASVCIMGNNIREPKSGKIGNGQHKGNKPNRGATGEVRGGLLKQRKQRTIYFSPVAPMTLI